jgi:hypothetical protein
MEPSNDQIKMTNFIHFYPPHVEYYDLQSELVGSSQFYWSAVGTIPLNEHLMKLYISSLKKLGVFLVLWM